MKSRYYPLLLFVILFNFSCKEQLVESKKDTYNSSRILNKDFNVVLKSLIRLQKLTFDHYSKNFYAQVISTEESVYLKVSTRDCDEFSQYFKFEEKIDSTTVYFSISEAGMPEELFHLDDLELKHNPNFRYELCHDWYWVRAKFIKRGKNLAFERATSFYDNKFEDYFFDETDSAFLKESNLFVPEPVPPVEPES